MLRSKYEHGKCIHIKLAVLKKKKHKYLLEYFSGDDVLKQKNSCNRRKVILNMNA